MIVNTNSLSIHMVSLETVFDLKSNDIYSLCRGISRKWKYHSAALESADLTQIAVTKVWLASRQLDVHTDIMPLAATIAINSCYDVCKSPKNEQCLSFDETFMTSIIKDEYERHEDIDSEFEFDFQGEESCASDINLESVLSGVSPRQRIIIEKTFAVGRSQWEHSDESIAESLGITRQTVSAERKKAFEIIRNRYGKRTKKGIGV